MGGIQLQMVSVSATVERQLGVPAAAAFWPKEGSLLPAKKKLVKTMMLDFIVQNFLRCFKSLHPNRTLEKKNKNRRHHVFPF
ncbi:hypothetical protein C2S52_011551 [Perilla frutescens var. hirtella]|nr:hypothetical protein C2S52_011551 [Perilla frutescens var. hirtella]KAH6785801.1 hypothetical protein C2S51_038256 [Perilla frutescens var. frutescens]